MRLITAIILFVTASVFGQTPEQRLNRLEQQTRDANFKSSINALNARYDAESNSRQSEFSQRQASTDANTIYRLMHQPRAVEAPVLSYHEQFLADTKYVMAAKDYYDYPSVTNPDGEVLKRKSIAHYFVYLGKITMQSRLGPKYGDWYEQRQFDFKQEVLPLLQDAFPGRYGK